VGQGPLQSMVAGIKLENRDLELGVRAELRQLLNETAHSRNPTRSRRVLRTNMDVEPDLTAMLPREVQYLLVGRERVDARRSRKIVRVGDRLVIGKIPHD